MALCHIDKFLHEKSEYMNMKRNVRLTNDCIDDERKRFARLIHDELGNELILILKDVSSLQKEVPKSQEAIYQKIQTVKEHINVLISKTNKVISGLRPLTSDTDDIKTSILCFLEDYHKRTGIQFKTNLNSITVTLEKNLSTVLLDIFRELLINIYRHANASNVAITFKKNKDTMIMVVQDDGIGIAESNISNNKSYGIIGIKERIDNIGGKLDMKGNPTKGTTVTVTLPINKNI